MATQISLTGESSPGGAMQAGQSYTVQVNTGQSVQFGLNVTNTGDIDIDSAELDMLVDGVPTVLKTFTSLGSPNVGAAIIGAVIAIPASVTPGSTQNVVFRATGTSINGQSQSGINVSIVTQGAASGGIGGVPIWIWAAVGALVAIAVRRVEE